MGAEPTNSQSKVLWSMALATWTAKILIKLLFFCKVFTVCSGLLAQIFRVNMVSMVKGYTD